MLAFLDIGKDNFLQYIYNSWKSNFEDLAGFTF